MFRPMPIMLALLLMFPAVAMSEQTDEDIRTWVELGAGWVENGNGRFGEYSYQLRDDGLFGLGGFGVDWQQGQRFGNLTADASASALDLQGLYGQWGDYRLGLDFRQFEVTDRGGFRSAIADRDSDQTLPPGYSDIVSAGAFPGNADWRRTQTALRGERSLGAWQLSAELASENREGNRINGASERFGDAVLLAVPVDQWHHTFELAARYGAGPWRLNLNSYYSHFSNDDQLISYENPLNTAAPSRTLDTAPDNDYLNLGVDGHYRIAPTRQLSWFASHAEMRQDADFVEPLLVGGSAINDLDGRRSHSDIRVAYRERVSRRLDYRLRWDYRRREDRTDVIELEPGVYTHRYDRQRRRLRADAGWRLPARTRLRLGVSLGDTDRTTRGASRYTDSVDETQYWAELRLPTLAAIEATARVERHDRDSDLSAHRRQALDPTAPQQALPEYLIPGDEWRYQLRGDLPLGQTWLLAADYRRRNTAYDNPYYGLRGRDSDSYSLSLSWQPSATLSLSAYGLIQDLRYSQDGLEYYQPGDFRYANARWRQTVDDDSRSLGLSVNWQPEPALSLALTLNHSDDDSTYHSRWLEDADTGEPAGTRDTLPGYGSDRQRINLSVDWQYHPRMALELDYLYERLRHSDWAWEDDFQQLAFGWESPRYDSHALMVSMRYRMR